MKTPLQIRRTRDGCRRSRRRRSPVFVKSWNLIAAMVMLSSLIGSIALTPASSVVAATPECDNGQVWDDSQQMCVDPTPEGGDQDMPTETPADMATETPEMTPTPASGTISVYKYTCPQMYDFGAGGDPASDCTIPTDGVTMTLADASQQQQQQQTSGGVATFSNVMPGQFSLTETAPSDTAQAAWTCESPMQAPTSGSGSQIQGQIGEGEQLSCRFYNVPNGITIIVNKFMCPEGYDPSDQNANPSQDCAQPQNGVQFNVSGQTTGYTSQSNTGDSVNGAVTFGGLQPDTYRITETLPQGFDRAFVSWCTITLLDGSDSNQQPQFANGSIAIGLSNTVRTVVCDWYNVPGNTGTPEMTPTPTMEMGSATPTMPSNGLTILVHKFTCPAGYDVSGQNADPEVDCATMQDGVQFNTTGQTTGYAAQTNTGDSIPGTVMFGGLQPDTYTIVETPPMGTDSAFVTYCTLSTTNDPDVPIYPTVSNWSIQEQFDETATKFECYWYNVPSIEGSGDGTPTTMTPTMTPTMSGTPTATSTEPSTLYIYKWQCPDGYNWGAPGANPQVDCATPMNGVQFNITGQTNGYTSQTNTGDSIPGAVMFGSIAPDTYHVVETLPANIESAFVTSCAVVANEAPILVALEGTPTVQGDLHPVVNMTGETDIVVPGGVTITCQWYNVPKMGSSDLTIHKQNCDVETYVNDSTCAPNTTGVTFEVYRYDGANWVLKASAATDANGIIALSGLNPGTYKLTELGGMWCDIKAIRQNGDGGTVSVLNPDGSFELVDGFETVVTVSNCTGGYGDITIYKWTCPPGYDYTKYGADPKTECTQVTNGIQFNLAGQTKGYTSQTNTGDSINGAVMFGSIPTDTYTVTETVPADTWYVFVWDCTGSSVNQVNPMPLSTGNVLNIKVATNDKIVCNWYNVPNRTSGDLTIYKQWCSQPVYTSDVDCTIYEKGMKFTVNAWNGAAWTPVATEMTNNLGYIAISGLNPGTYQVVEQGGTPCKVVATQLDPNTNKPVSVLNPDQSFPVTNGRETVVTVSNCTPKGHKPPPTKVPSKYPNTGVDPNATSHRSAQDTQVIEPGTPQTVEAPEATTTTGTPESGEVVCPTLTAADNAAQSPIGTPIPDTTCVRGQVPASISIPAIQVDATFEIKEIVGGELQEPTNENVVTWYKNTNRLGETGNVVVAGHLNYWGVPEAVFFKLNTLQPGDLITVTGADGGTYTYAVTSVQSVPITESPETWVGPTDKETLTLMTCGGEWDSSISEYDSRTVVVAVRVPNPEAQQGGA